MVLPVDGVPVDRKALAVTMKVGYRLENS